MKTRLGVTDWAEVAAEEPLDPELIALFVKKGLGAVCADVCKRLGVKRLDELKQLKLVPAQDLYDELPKYLTLVQKREVVAMIEGQPKGDGNTVIPFLGVVALIGVVVVAVQMVKRK